MATQKEVAKLAGVSFITVSRVINKEGNVKESTRKKVELAIKKLGYVPSFAGKALNSGRCDTIGVMTPDRFGEGIENSYLIGILRGIEIACRERNQDILLSVIGEKDPNFDYLRPYRQKKVDGMIYVGLKCMPDDLGRDMKELSLPCIVIGDRPTQNNVSWIDTDNEKAAYEACKIIWSRGHRIIAFLGLSDDLINENISDRERGFKKAIQELSGNIVDESFIWRSSFEIEDIQKSIRENIRNANQQPTAILCSTDTKALVALREINKMGLSVPEDISLVGFDGFLGTYLTHPTIATNVQPLIDMGKKATELLLEKIKNRNSERHNVIYPVPFRDGESLSYIKSN